MSQRGFALVPVVLVLLLVAVAAVALNTGGGLGASLAGSRGDALQARYAAEAAFQHARWKLSRQSGCSGYPDVASNTPFEGGTYRAQVNPNNNSPVRIRARATTASGAYYEFERSVPKLDPLYTLSLQPGPEGFDTRIASSDPDTNYGRHEELRITAGEGNALLRFDLSKVPAGSRIESAVLWLDQKTVLAVSGSLGVYRMTRAWTEGTAAGGANTPDGATWNGPAPNLTWATPGGEYEATPVALQSFLLAAGWKSWDITPLAQGWSEGVFPNYGVLVRAVSAIGSELKFYSGDEGTQVTLRPRLAISYRAPCGTPAPTVVDGLVAWWKLDEGAGSVAADAAGAHPGTLSNATWTTGQKNGGLAFDGSTSTVQAAHADDLSLSAAFTLAAWVKPGAFPTYQVILNKGLTGTNSNYYLMLNGRELMLGFYSGGYQTFSTSGLNLQADTWYHVAGSFDDASNQVRLYVNGSLVYTGSSSKHPATNTEGLWIGRSPLGDNWNGVLDDVRIYNRALSDAEVGLVAGQTTVKVAADALLDGRVAYRDINYGNYGPLRVNGADPARSVLRFDTTQIAQAAIASAKLRFNLRQKLSPSGSSVPVSVYALTESWTEGTRTGSGTADGVTWNRRDGSVLWTAPGGTLAATAAGIATVPSTQSSGWVEADITALVQQWVAGSTVNNGVALVHGGAAPSSDLLEIESLTVPASAAQLKVIYQE